ncbi:hypothetical protein [Sphingomicrobium aestuariivivum]|uniref:hypothetical protein n=1 Tax=Sphingomicrobium aestuariivivum TaxID=1582356 RepID=UPI001FD69562|nr:hypothetical protein [Sphingomicrobium aestuariivivum]MCJ8190412.1 hypothetical protein [Sphingomicrobium aestuariivivum]
MKLLVNILALGAAAMSLPWLLSGMADPDSGSTHMPASTAAGFCQLTFDQIAADDYSCRLGGGEAVRD